MLQPVSVWDRVSGRAVSAKGVWGLCLRLLLLLPARACLTEQHAPQRRRCGHAGLHLDCAPMNRGLLAIDKGMGEEVWQRRWFGRGAGGEEGLASRGRVSFSVLLLPRANCRLSSSCKTTLHSSSLAAVLLSERAKGWASSSPRRCVRVFDAGKRGF